MTTASNIALQYAKIQQSIVTVLEKADGIGKFDSRQWTKPVGSGNTMVMINGSVIEKGAVNFSAVSGKYTPQMEKILGEKAGRYAATGISSILHPHNPWVPVIHMNVRFFELDTGMAWFGGGIDLTPHIINPKEAAWFHSRLKSICDGYDESWYPNYKAWADEYYYLPHRQETRGVGGIFFDRIKPQNKENLNRLFNFTADLANAYPVIYSHFMNNNKNREFSQREKKWQYLRRGRYVEFNLIHDRGTKFGLESGGNTESILASLPPEASWEYEYQPMPSGFEEKTLGLLKKGIDWIKFAE